jgi:hypothetical protein
VSLKLHTLNEDGKLLEATALFYLLFWISANGHESHSMTPGWPFSWLKIMLRLGARSRPHEMIAPHN